MCTCDFKKISEHLGSLLKNPVRAVRHLHFHPPSSSVSKLHALTERWKNKSCKYFRPLPAIGVFIAALALIWAIKSFKESALANELAMRESCRSHPVSICSTSLCFFDDKIEQPGASGYIALPGNATDARLR
jgi:hypothetical protein